MSDLISRDFLLKSIDYIADIGGIWGRAFTAYKEAFKEFVEGMPPAQRWIPVSKRLPEERGRYICYIANEYIITCKWYPDIKAWFPDSEYSSDDVKAWMPLPEPYQEDK